MFCAVTAYGVGVNSCRGVSGTKRAAAVGADANLQPIGRAVVNRAKILRDDEQAVGHAHIESRQRAEISLVPVPEL